MLSGNSLRQTVHTHHAVVHQAAKLVAALLRVVRITAGLAESNGSLPPDLWITSPAGWLPSTGISSGTLHSVIEYGLPYQQKYKDNTNMHDHLAQCTLCGKKEWKINHFYLHKHNYFYHTHLPDVTTLPPLLQKNMPPSHSAVCEGQWDGCVWQTMQKPCQRSPTSDGLHSCR